MGVKEKKQQLRELLNLHYGFNSFRPGQEKVIDNVLAGKSTVVIMPTGGGKSLCFQLPALVLEGVTIVISPLISLMKDQVDELKRIGLPATFINSSISSSETYNRIEAVKNGQYKLLYIAPERFYSAEFIGMLKDIKVSLFAIDEAHCISQWGHDFRPSYLKLSEAIKLAGEPLVMALTATATTEVREDIIAQLGLEPPELVITGFARPNLQFGVINAAENLKPRHVLDVISSAPDETGIIYAGTRARVDKLLQILLENNIEAASYHAGMDAEDRKWVQNNFLSGKAKVIVATNAFGLGIDKANVRYVIHYDMPGTIEAYYQEAGRAGRDSKSSLCLLLSNSRDRALHEFFIKGDNPPPEITEEIYDILLSYESDTVLITYAEISSMLSDSVPEMAIGTSLKLLEKEAYVSRAREKSGNAYVKQLKDYNYIIDTFNSRSRKQKDLFIALHEHFGEELSRGWQVNFEEAAAILDVKKDRLTRLVRKLSDKGLFEYNPPFRGTEIRILKREKPKDIKLDREELKAKLKRAYAKLGKMEDYVYHFGCRQKYILNYFGDLEAKDCGKCDICLSKNGYERKTKIPARESEKTPSASSGQARKQENKPRSSLNTKLTQLETLELYNKGAEIDKIAEIRGLNRDTIINHLCFLIEKGLIKDIDKLVDKKTQLKIEKVIEKTGLEKLKPIYEELGENINYDDIKITAAKIKLDNKKN